MTGLQIAAVSNKQVTLQWVARNPVAAAAIIQRKNSAGTFEPLETRTAGTTQ